MKMKLSLSLPFVLSDWISFFFHSQSCVWKYAPLATLSPFSFLLSFVMLFISCRWSQVTGYNCILHDWLYELQWDWRLQAPLCALAHLCVCVDAQFCAGVVLAIEHRIGPCSHTVLSSLWFILLFGIVFVIPEDNITFILLPQYFLIRKILFPTLYRCCSYCTIAFPYIQMYVQLHTYIHTDQWFYNMGSGLWSEIIIFCSLIFVFVPWDLLNVSYFKVASALHLRVDITLI